MLISLDESFADDLSRGAEALASLNALDALAMARREGRHLVFAERELLDRVLEYAAPHVTQRTMAVLQHVSNSLPQLGALAAQVTRRLVVCGPNEQLNAGVTASGNEIRIPSPVVAQGAVLQEPIFLTEHAIDGRFLMSLCKAWLRQQRSIHSDLPLKYALILGGGNTVADQLALIKQQQRLCLTVTDSDRQYPGGGVGDTARRVQENDQNAPSLLTESYLLPVRSAENMCSAAMLRAAFDGDGQRMQVFQRILQLANFEQADVWDFFPMKRGITFCQIYPSAEGAKLYWFQVAQERGLLDDLNCPVAQGQCGVQACPNLLIPGLGDQVLAVVSDYLEGAGHATAQFSPLARIRDGLNGLSDLFISWFCAGTEVRT